MAPLYFYAALDRAGLRNYRAKIMVVAFIGTHIPLIALLAYVAAQTSADWVEFAWTLGVTLIATLVGTGITLAVLHQLLKPLSLTSKALRRFRTDRTLLPLPSGFADEAGTLMSDAADTMTHLVRAMHMLEHVDDVTGLPNRKRMLALIEEHIAKAAPFAIAIVRFADYSRIAATLDFSHAQTATILMAGRLRIATNADDLRSAAILGALSGSEFVLLLPGAENTESITEFLLKIVRDTAAQITLSDLQLYPTLTTGAALFPADGSDAIVLLDYATAAVALAGPAAPVMLHSQEARAAGIDRYRMEKDLGTALFQNQLELHYQPVVDLSAGRVVGAEALVRWHHPTRGLVPPGVFIPVAEASGLMDKIGAWILQDACRQLSEWTAVGQDLHVAVNLSARQLADPDLYRRMHTVIHDSGIDPSRLEVELTETAAMTDHDHSRAVFGALRDLGLGIAIDDFGTGYASLSTLRSLPFTKLKIDREFVTDVERTPASQAICEALLALSRGLNIRVLAEGTEKIEEVRFLNDRGCALFQGYHFARPVPVADFDAAVDRINLNLRSRTFVAA